MYRLERSPSMPSLIRQAIGAVKDSTSISLARLSKTSSSSTLEVAVLKATSHEDIPIDDRYLSQIYLLSSSSPSLAAACVHALSRRISRTSNWIVALKSLAVVFHLLRHGSCMIIKELTVPRRSRRLLDFSNFRDDSAVCNSLDYSVFVQDLAAYLDARLQSAVRGKISNLGRRPVVATRIFTNMKIQTILDRIEHWQRLLDRAIGTCPTDPVRTNRLVQIALYLVVSETYILYRDISNGLSLLLDNFFRLPHATCLKTFKACAKGRKQFEELESFYDMCKEIGVGRKSEYPIVQKISVALLDQLEEFLKNQPRLLAASPNDHRKSPPKLLTSTSTLQQKSSEQRTPRGGWRSMGGATMSDWESVLPSIYNDLQLQVMSSNGNSSDEDEITSQVKQPDLLGGRWQKSSEQRTPRGGWRSMGGETMSDWESVLPSIYNDLQPQVMSSNGNSSDEDEITSQVKQPDLLGCHKKAASESNLFDGWEILLSASVDDMLKEADDHKSVESSMSMPPPESLESTALANPHENAHHNPFLPYNDETSPLLMPPLQSTFCTREANEVVAYDPENNPFLTSLQASSTQTQVNDDSMNQRVLHEQNLWMQQQNKIIAKRLIC